MQRVIISKNTAESEQLIAEDSMITGAGWIEPFFSFQGALDLYYENTWHRRCLLTKSGLLSQIAETNLEKFLPKDMNPKTFLKAFVLNLEIYGTAFLESAGVAGNNALYLIPSVEARVDSSGNIYQITSIGQETLEGHVINYYSPRSRFYGEPDYLATARQLQVDSKIHTHNASFFDNRATPDTAIIFEGCEPSDEQLDAFRMFFQTQFKGSENAHKTLIMSAPPALGESTPKIHMEKLNQVEDMSFEKLRIMTREEILAAHNMPPRLVGIIQSGQLGGGGEMIGQLHAFNETELKPKIDMLEWWFNTIGVSLKLNELDVTNFKDDADMVTGLVQTGIISPVEAKEILGWGNK